MNFLYLLPSYINFIKVVQYNLIPEHIVYSKNINPLYCICKIALLSYYPIGTKLSFQKNKIEIHRNKLFTPLKRQFYGDEREDIKYLMIPLNRFIYFFVNEQSTEKNDKIEKLLNITVSGLENLRDTYYHKKKDNSELILIIIDSYISQIKNLLYYKSIKSIECLNNVNNTLDKFHDDYNIKKYYDYTETQLDAILLIFNEYNKKKDNYYHEEEFCNFIHHYTKVIDLFIDTE